MIGDIVIGVLWVAIGVLLVVALEGWKRANTLNAKLLADKSELNNKLKEGLELLERGRIRVAQLSAERMAIDKVLDEAHISVEMEWAPPVGDPDTQPYTLKVTATHKLEVDDNEPMITH